MARGHRQQLCRRAQDSGQAVPGAQEYAGAVLAAKAQRQRLVAGLGRGAPAFGRGGRLSGRAERGLRLREPPPGRLVLFGEIHVLGVETVDLRLQSLVLLLGRDRALLGLVAGGGQPVDLGLGGGGA